MLTFQQKWQSLHHPSTDVSGDMPFYYDVYGRLLRILRQEARQSDAAILSLLLYTENIIATGLDGVYEYMYRSLGDVVFRWCDGLGMDANATSQVHNLVSEAVAEAPRSTLRRWITEKRTWPSTGATSKETLCRPPLPNSSASWPYLRKEKKNPSCWKRPNALRASAPNGWTLTRSLAGKTDTH